MIEIDGSYGEGGGQLVRTAIAIAAVRGTAIRVINVRARRSNPGLAPQHVAAVRAVASLCDGRCEGATARSTTLQFEPGRLHGGEFQVDVGTAGSVTLVLQAMLPVLLAARERARVVVRGGTDVRAAPPADYLRLVLLPLLEAIGARIRLSVARRGYYPKGGGEVRLEVEPAARLRPFVVPDAGALDRIEIHAHVTLLAREIGQRMADAARHHLPRGARIEADVQAYAPGSSYGPGGAVVLRALAQRTVLGAGRIAERGIRAEQLGQQAAEALVRDLNAGATLDVHAADQMLTFLALADGPSEFEASEVTSHARTAMWLLERLAGTRFTVAAGARGERVRVRPGDRVAA